MLDYEKKYLELTQGVTKCIDDVSNEFIEATGFEKAVIAMRRLGWSYADIQKKLGMPSKKDIRSALLKWSPELIDNSKKKIISISSYESELYNLIKGLNQSKFIIEDEEWLFFIKDNKLKYIDSWGDEDFFSGLDNSIQSQLLNQIKDQINERT